MKIISAICGIFCTASLAAQIVYTDNVWLQNRITFARNNNEVIPEPTAFRIRTTPSALVVEVKLGSAAHWKKFQEKPFTPVPSKWPREESVEIFLDPGRSCSKYIQLAAGVYGSLFDKRLEKKPWTAKWTVTREDFKGGVILKFVIPFDETMKKPETGDIWGFNICRNVKTAAVYFSTFAKVGARFHSPSKFAELRFGTETTFAEANLKKNLKQLSAVEKEISEAGLSSHFAVRIAKLRKSCNETDIQAIKDELRLMKIMKDIK